MTGRPSTGRGRSESEARLGQALSEGQRLEAYAEQQTREMRSCSFCDRIGYHRLPMKPIGHRWICIDCVKSLKETMDSLDRWEQASAPSSELDPARPWGAP